MSSLFFRLTGNAPTSGLSTPTPSFPCPGCSTRSYWLASFLISLRSLLKSYFSEAFYLPLHLKFLFILLTFHVPFHAFLLLNIYQYLIHYLLYLFIVSNGYPDHQNVTSVRSQMFLYFVHCCVSKT